MKKAQLEILLSKLDLFESPNAALEQYPTDSKSAALILWAAFQYGDIEGKTVADLGCGTGILGIGALMLGAEKVHFIDKDKAAVEKAKANLEFIEKELKTKLSEKAEFITAGISDFSEKVDTVIQNPPFGTKKEHADLEFLQKAVEIGKTVYSIHKSSTMDFIRRIIEKKGERISDEISLNMQLKSTMPWHKKRIQAIEASCLRIVKAK